MFGPDGISPEGDCRPELSSFAFPIQKLPMPTDTASHYTVNAQPRAPKSNHVDPNYSTLPKKNLKTTLKIDITKFPMKNVQKIKQFKDLKKKTSPND